MQLPTIEFFVFFVGIFVIAALLKNKKTIYPYFLLLVSAIFYASWSLDFLLIIAAEIVITYLLLLGIYANDGKRGHRKKHFLIAGIVFTAIVWIVFKYFNFFTTSLLELTQNIGMPANFSIIQLLAPLGISFYSFRIVSHFFDSYRGQIEKKPSFIEYANYVAFFPQIAAGPIATAGEFYEDLRNRDYFYNFNNVLLLLTIGIFKKYVLASFLFDFIRDPFVVPTSYSPIDLVIAAVGYSALIYVDFSGYTDLATAISNMLGFRVPQNFNMPYQSTSLAEFWRRWHMTLGRWLKSYMYIPLGGSRQGAIRKHINLIITLTFSGVWHGVGFNFAIWGFMHGVGLVINDIFKQFREKYQHLIPVTLRVILSPAGIFLSWLLTFGFVVFSRIFFNTSTIDKALEFIKGLFVPYTSTNVLMFDYRMLFIVGFVLLMNFIELPFLRRVNLWLDRRSYTFRIFLFAAIAYVLIHLGPETVAPFIYYKF